MVLKRKEIVAASLVLLIGIAGYLNWSYQDSIQVTDGESYIETGKKLGEAQYVSNVEEVEDKAEDKAEEEKSEQTADIEVVSDSDGGFFEQARIDREAARSQSMEILNNTASNTDFDEEIRKKAGEKILQISSDIENENAIESIAQSKGYSEVCAYINDNMARIMVRKEGFGAEDVVKITDIATETLNLSANSIKIVEVQ